MGWQLVRLFPGNSFDSLLQYAWASPNVGSNRYDLCKLDWSEIGSIPIFPHHIEHSFTDVVIYCVTVYVWIVLDHYFFASVQQFFRGCDLVVGLIPRFMRWSLRRKPLQSRSCWMVVETHPYWGNQTWLAIGIPFDLAKQLDNYRLDWGNSSKSCLITRRYPYGSNCMFREYLGYDLGGEVSSQEVFKFRSIL